MPGLATRFITPCRSVTRGQIRDETSRPCAAPCAGARFGSELRMMIARVCIVMMVMVSAARAETIKAE
ncbi:MAG TPA: hypothetical protein VIU61_17675, partial [Kofleriaceae bacterium]